MDCDVPVDDLCDARQAEYLETPQKIPSSGTDQFYIVLDVQTNFPSLDEEDDDEPTLAFLDEDDEDKVEKCCLKFWAPCPRIKRGNLTRNKISDMLSRAAVPRHKQEFMVDRISAKADEIANAVRNEGERVLPMMVLIRMIACKCYGESVVD